MNEVHIPLDMYSHLLDTPMTSDTTKLSTSTSGQSILLTVLIIVIHVARLFNALF